MIRAFTSAATKAYVRAVIPGYGSSIDYSGIIASLNLLTDTLDSAYDGTDPILTGMETQLDTINGEIITV